MSEAANTEAKHAPKPEHRCEHHYDNGDQCRGTKTRTGKCAGHSRLGIAANPAEGAKASAEARQAKAEQRSNLPKTLKEVYAAELEANARPIVARLKAIALNGSDAASLSAIEQWTSRVYGKPTDKVETTVTVPEALADLHGKSPEERSELLRQLAAGKRLRLVLEEPEIPANSDIPSAHAGGQ